MQAEHLTIDDILYSPVREHTSGRTLDHVTIDNKPELDRPFADAPAERFESTLNAACEALMSAPPTATDWLNNHLSNLHQNAQSQIWQQQALQQSLQQAIGYQQQNLQQYLNTSASNAINPYMQMMGAGSLNTTVCPITGRQVISEAEAVRQIGAMLGGTFG